MCKPIGVSSRRTGSFLFFLLLFCLFYLPSWISAQPVSLEREEVAAALPAACGARFAVVQAGLFLGSRIIEAPPRHGNTGTAGPKVTFGTVFLGEIAIFTLRHSAHSGARDGVIKSLHIIGIEPCF